MWKIATFLILLSQFPYKINTSGACAPNTQALVDGKFCQCNNDGEWTNDNCQSNVTEGKQACQPGQVLFQGCNRCVCQENGQLACKEESCSNQQYQNINENLTKALPWCNPFRTYYISCNICVCPASGRTADANCAIDVSCTIFKEPTTSEKLTKISTCIPKVMYLFPCLHCLCSDDGFLFLDKCIETCAKKEISESTGRCIPRTLYRQGCNVCRCPENSFRDDKLCTKSICKQESDSDLHRLKGQVQNCTVNQFTKPRCIYCDCNRDGVVDRRNCLETECLKPDDFDIKYNVFRTTCNPGEMVPFCTECLCVGHGATSADYCSDACSYESKLKVIEKIIIANQNPPLNLTSLRTLSENEKCETHSVYKLRDRYCLCPENEIMNFNLCTTQDIPTLNNNNKTNKRKILIDFNASCEPNTFVEFDCNTCFCSRRGNIDPKWCTYDDCEAKREVQELYKSRSKLISSEAALSDVCSPGIISKVKCNFCICPESGRIDSSACTKNDCAELANKPLVYEDLSCEPLAYYEVDCNVCFCPRDGLKNVAKCTKHHCEKGFLRTDVCLPGQLFSDGCNVCVCPPNGNKAERACTNSTCTDTAPWKKIYQLSESLLGNQIVEDATRNLDLCFPGEEFVVGCKLCVCPDMGLRYYASCSPTLCEEDRQDERAAPDISGSNRDIVIHRKLNTRRDQCITVNVTGTITSKCVPGSMYIVRCKQCICPYMGDLMKFCRSLPAEFYCEQPFPGINYMKMGRRNDDIEGRNSSVTITTPLNVTHEHTRYECSKSGKISDSCFICECEDSVLIEEHCFQSDGPGCAAARPSFLVALNTDYLES